MGGFDVSSPNVITAHVETREYTDRNGNHQSRNRAVLDVIGDELAGKALTMLDAARGTMPLLAITDQDAVNLRYGRRISYDIHGTVAAYLPQSGEVVALVERAKRGEAKPATVFGA